MLPGAVGGETLAGHLIEPVGGFFRGGEDGVGGVGEVFGTVEELEHEDGGGLHEVVREAPPGTDFEEADGIWLVRDEV